MTIYDTGDRVRVLHGGTWRRGTILRQLGYGAKVAYVVAVDHGPRIVALPDNVEA